MTGKIGVDVVEPPASEMNILSDNDSNVPRYPHQTFKAPVRSLINALGTTPVIDKPTINETLESQEAVRRKESMYSGE